MSARKAPVVDKAAAKAAPAGPAKRPLPTKSARPVARKALDPNRATPPKAGTGDKPITPEQALANTKALLEAKHEHDRQPQPWQGLEAPHGQPPQPGFQSDEAAHKAGDLHAGESRMQAIQGSVGSQGRHNQGKRDKR